MCISALLNVPHLEMEKEVDIQDDEDINSPKKDAPAQLSTSDEAEDKGSNVAGAPKRYVLLLMTFIGFVNIYCMRVNLNVALVAMVNDQIISKKGAQVVKVGYPLK